MTKTDLENLRKETEYYDVIVARASSDGKPDIGIRRRTIFDESMLDPLVEDFPVMIAGDVYDASSNYLERVSDIEDLYGKLIEDVSNFYVCLRVNDYRDSYIIGLYEIVEVVMVYGNKGSYYPGTEAFKIRIKKI